MIDGYNMGRHCSTRSFGHGGAFSSTAFADPDRGLAAAVLCNGMTDIANHHARFSGFFTTLYEDLGLAEAGEPGRDKPEGRYA